MEEDKQYIEGKKCVKCPEPAQFAGVDVKKAVYCRPCFVNMVRNKFRTALSKRKIFREGEERECVVIFDGGISACFLLHQISDALQQIVYKRLMIRPTFVVLVSSLEETSIAHVLEKVPALQELFPASVPFVTVHLAAGLCKEPVQLENGRCQGVAQIPLLKQLLDSCKTSTAREEVLRLLREKTTSLIARSLGIHKIMLPDDGNQLGRLALAQLCLGRGGWLSEMTAVLEKRSSGVTFIRPLRDVSSKEVAIVSHLEEYEKSAIRTNEKQNFAAGSIQAATSTFVDNLFAEGFKATVTTVLSTASKLHVATPEIVCPLCELGAVESGHDLCSCCISLLDEVKEPDFFRTYLL